MPQPAASATLNTGGSLYTNLVCAAMVGSDGTVFKDYRQGVTATLTNCAVVTGSGSEKGVQLDASGDYATFSNSAEYDPEGNIDWTMFVFGDIATGNADGSYRSFMSRADDTAFSTDRWMFQCNFVQRLAINDATAGNLDSGASIATSAANNSSYAVRRSGSTLKFYENGAPDGSTATFAGGFGTGNTSSLRLGDPSVPVLGTWKMMAIWKGTALSDADIASLHADPWQLWSTAQTAVPTSDVTTGAWRSSAGGALYAALDESAADDSDHVYVSSNDTGEVGFGSLTDPASSSSHVVSYRASVASGKTLTVRLVQGTTVIASWTHTGPVTLALFQQTLSGGEADSITNYADLRLRFVTS